MSKRVAITSFLCAVLLPGCNAPRREQPVSAVAGPWIAEDFVGRELTTPHFRLLSTLADSELETALPEFLEAAYVRYERTVPATRSASERLTVYVFGTRSQWDRFVRQRFPARHALVSRIRCGGFTENGASVLFHVDRASTLATLAHEGWHQYIRVQVGDALPPWLDEGLACTHEALEFAGQLRFTPQRNTFRTDSLRKALKDGRLFSLRQLVNAEAGRLLRDDRAFWTQTYYAQAWALVTFLQHDAGHGKATALARLLDDVASGSFVARVRATSLTEGHEPADEFGTAAFRAYFGCHPDDLTAPYHDHLVRLCRL